VIKDHYRNKGIKIWNLVLKCFPRNFLSNPQFCPLKPKEAGFGNMNDYIRIIELMIYVWRSVSTKNKNSDPEWIKIHSIIGKLFKILNKLLNTRIYYENTQTEINTIIEGLEQEIELFLREWYATAPFTEWSMMIHLLLHMPKQIRTHGSLRSGWTFDMER